MAETLFKAGLSENGLKHGLGNDEDFVIRTRKKKKDIARMCSYCVYVQIEKAHCQSS